AQRPDNGAVVLGKASGKSRASHLGGHIFCLDKILDAYRHAINARKRTTFTITLCRSVSRGSGSGFIDDDPPFQYGLSLLYHFQTTLEVFTRRVGSIKEFRSCVVKG